MKWFELLIGISHLTLSASFAGLSGITVTSVKTAQVVDLASFLNSTNDDKGGLTMLILGTYAADFNAIEYAQRLRYYLPELRKNGVTKIGAVFNCEEDSAKALVDLVDLPCDVSQEDAVTLMVDPLGKAGRAFGVGRGWRPDDLDMSPYFKLFGMLWGLGAWATLPAVLGGYIGNPFAPQRWIEDAMSVGQRMGRWPDMALILDENNENVVRNKFTELPLVGNWPRRPLELATLRLQNMLGISMKKWQDLAPNNEALMAGVLTQLGGCVVYDPNVGKVVFEWRDPGICAVANFENILEALKGYSSEKDKTL